ncbi:MAG: alpha/beta hydrolase [Hyphomicrobiaceae bacterium]
MTPIEDVDLDIIAETLRTINDRGAFDELIASWSKKLTDAGYDLALLRNEQVLKKHYSTIGKLLDKVGLADTEDPLERIVSSVREPAMVLSDRGRVVSINETGRAAFRVEQGQKAHFDWLGEPLELTRERLEPSPAGSPNHRMRIVKTISDTGTQGYAEVFPVEVKGVQGSFTVVRELLNAWVPAAGAALSEAFGLTDAEVEIARLLYVHGDLSLVAADRSVSVRTARLQLSSVFAKTATSGQTELMRLLVLLNARLTDRPERRSLSWSDPFGREKIIRRPDGRRLAYTWMGHADGTPAMFVHGIGNGFLYPDVFVSTLVERRVKLFVLERPGCGNSDPDPRQGPCEDLAQSINTLCAALGLKSVTVTAIHAGVIAVARAARQPGSAISGIVALGRFLPYTPELLDKVPKPVRTLTWLSLHAPWATDIIGRYAWSALHQYGVDWYIERAYREMSFDYASTKSHEVTALIRNASAFTFLQGPEVFFRDMVIRKTDIRDDLAALDIPFHWLLGAVPVYGGIETGERFYSDADIQSFLTVNPRITFELVPDAGELMIYQQPALIAERIADSVLRSP